MITIQQTFHATNIPVIQISNMKIDLKISLDFGPRILFCGFSGGPNHFFNRQSDLENHPNEQDSFHFFGGHRLWVAPEDPVLSYIPDNQPVTWQQENSSVIFNQCVKVPHFYLTKELEIQIHPTLSQVEVNHRITNLDDQPIELAPWAISQMAPGGLAVIQLPKRGSHIGNLLPTSSLVLWPYTDLSDSRWRWGYEFIRVQQDMTITKPLKFGLASDQGWLAYFNHGQMFQKQTHIQPDANYPDRGTPIQIFLDGDFLELETMGPLNWLNPGQTVTHHETWNIVSDCPPPRNAQQIKDILEKLES